MEIGAGIDFYLPYFKFATELKFSLGLQDILNHKLDSENPEADPYTHSINRMSSKVMYAFISFRINTHTFFIHHYTMLTEINLVLSPRDASDENVSINFLVAKNLKIECFKNYSGIQILRRSIDARQRNIKVNMRFRVAYDEVFPDIKLSDFVLPRCF